MGHMPISSIKLKSPDFTDGAASVLKKISSPASSAPKAIKTLEDDVFGIPRIALTGLDKIHQKLTRIFDRTKTISKAEAEAMVTKYKEILKTEDDTDYITKLFEQVKQDFGYGDNKNIFLAIKEDSPESHSLAGFNQQTGQLNIRKSPDRKSIFNAMFHEFTHVRLDEIAFRTKGAKEHFVEMNNRLWKEQYPNVFEKGPELVLKASQETADAIFEQRRRVFGDLPEFNEESMYNSWGRQYAEADFNYVPAKVNYAKYRENIHEQAAHRNGELAEEIFECIAEMK